MAIAVVLLEVKSRCFLSEVGSIVSNYLSLGVSYMPVVTFTKGKRVMRRSEHLVILSAEGMQGSYLRGCFLGCKLEPRKARRSELIPHQNFTIFQRQLLKNGWVL